MQVCEFTKHIQKTWHYITAQLQVSHFSVNVSSQGDICAAWRIAAKLATFLSFVRRDILSSKPLVQDIQHFSAEIDEEKRQSP